MKTTTPPLRTLAPALAFAGLCVIAAIATWVAFGGSVPFQSKGYELNLVLTDATSLYPGSQVQISGVTIGKIDTVRLQRGSVMVTLAIDPPYAPMHAGARAVVRTKTLLGEGYVQLAPGPRSAPTIPDGGQLPVTHVEPRQQLQDVLQTFSPTTRARIGQLFTGIAKAFGNRSQALSNSLGNAAPTAANLTSVLGVLSSELPSLQAMIANAGTTFAAVGERQGELRAAVNAGDTVLATTATERAGLAATIDALPPFLRTLRTTSTSLGTLGAVLTPAVA
ncbi:MAG: MlaD family protein, partial [Solirubrobacteraceae bacterium]